MAAPFADAPPARPTVALAEVAAAVGSVALVGAFVLSPHGIEDGPVICPFRLVTGLPCPGCGLTRSWVYLAHGQWRDSFLAHPFGIVAVLLVVALVGTVVRARLRRTAPPDLDALVRRPWLLAVVGAWLLFAAGRFVLVATGS